MTESDFNNSAAATLDRIAQALEESAAQCDCELKDGGVLDIEFADGSRIIVNRHSAAREIWVAARSGGFHFRHDGANWVSARDGSELFAALSRFVSQQSGVAVILRSG
jgi:CyaY protein